MSFYSCLFDTCKCKTSMFLWNSHILITQIHHQWLLSPTSFLFAFFNHPYPVHAWFFCLPSKFFNTLHIMPSIHLLAVVHKVPDHLLCYLPGFSLLDWLIFFFYNGGGPFIKRHCISLSISSLSLPYTPSFLQSY